MPFSSGNDISHKVVALDPGRTTGYATGLIQDGRMYAKSGQAAWNHLQMYNELMLARPDVIVCEAFEFRQRTAKTRWGLDMYPRELIGVVELYVQQTEDCFLKMQQPNIKDAHFTDQMLKADKLHRRGMPHANDAMRHLLHWFNYGHGYQFNTGGYEPL